MKSRVRLGRAASTTRRDRTRRRRPKPRLRPIANCRSAPRPVRGGPALARPDRRRARSRLDRDRCRSRVHPPFVGSRACTRPPRRWRRRKGRSPAQRAIRRRGRRAPACAEALRQQDQDCRRPPSWRCSGCACRQSHAEFHLEHFPLHPGSRSLTLERASWALISRSRWAYMGVGERFPEPRVRGPISISDR